MSRQAIIFGATGAVGSQLLDLCLDEDLYSRVIVIARREAKQSHPRLKWITCAFDELDRLEPIPGLANGDAFCCLGTTIKAAGSQEQFRRVDFDFVVNAARFARDCAIRNFSVVSALGANAKSKNFYSRTKGEVEAALRAENLPSLRIFRPSLLSGKRDEFRLKEEIGNVVFWFMAPVFHLGLKRYQPIKIEKVARALIKTSTNAAVDDRVRIYESDEPQTF